MLPIICIILGISFVIAAIIVSIYNVLYIPS